jgi:hypothetical protein
MVRRTFKRLYGRDPYLMELDKGDDQWGVTTSWVDGAVLNRITRWTGFLGQDTKVLFGGGWSEYLRCLHDGNGFVCGCVMRTVATMVIASWQLSAPSHPIRMVVEACGTRARNVQN